MILDAILTDWVNSCRQYARLAREDVQRSAAFDSVTDPDATVRVPRRDIRTSETKN